MHHSNLCRAESADFGVKYVLYLPHTIQHFNASTICVRTKWRRHFRVSTLSSVSMSLKQGFHILNSLYLQIFQYKPSFHNDKRFRWGDGTSRNDMSPYDCSGTPGPLNQFSQKLNGPRLIHSWHYMYDTVIKMTGKYQSRDIVSHRTINLGTMGPRTFVQGHIVSGRPVTPPRFIYAKLCIWAVGCSDFAFFLQSWYA